MPYTISDALPIRYSPKVIVLIVLLLLGVIPPFYFLFKSSIHQYDVSGANGTLTLEYFVHIFTANTFVPTLISSLIYSFGTALVALVIGAAQAWLAERTDAPLRQLLYVASIISLGIPYVLYIVAWILFFGKAGPVNNELKVLFGPDAFQINIYSLGGMIFVEGMLWSPLAFLMLSSVFRNADASFEEAATMCGAGLPSTLRRITFGMARPALLALALLVFIKASESFEVPALVGLPGSTRVFTSTIYQRLILDMPPNIGLASAFGVMLLVVMTILLNLYSRVNADSHRYRTITGKGFRPRVVRLGRWRYLVAALIVAIPVFTVIIPFGTVLWAALLPFYEPFSIGGFYKLELTHFIEVLHSGSFRDTIGNTLILGALAATLVTGLASVAGWCVARRIPGSRLIDNLASLPLVFPAIVLGLAFLEIFVQSGPLLYETLLSLILVSTVAYIPYGLRYAQLGAIQIHPELEEAAGISGAGQAAIFFKIVFPLLVPALISCWLFIFLLAVRAMSMNLLLAGPDSQVVAVALFDLWSNGQVGELAALGCIWTAIMTVFSVAFFFLARRYQLPIG